MAPSSTNARGWLLCGLIAGGAGAAHALAATTPASSPAAAAAAAANAALPGRQLPITVDAASSEVDYRTNTVVFSEVVISQGAMRV